MASTASARSNSQGAISGRPDDRITTTGLPSVQHRLGELGLAAGQVGPARGSPPRRSSARASPRHSTTTSARAGEIQRRRDAARSPPSISTPGAWRSRGPATLRAGPPGWSPCPRRRPAAAHGPSMSPRASASGPSTAMRRRRPAPAAARRSRLVSSTIERRAASRASARCAASCSATLSCRGRADRDRRTGRAPP